MACLAEGYCGGQSSNSGSHDNDFQRHVCKAGPDAPVAKCLCQTEVADDMHIYLFFSARRRCKQAFDRAERWMGKPKPWISNHSRALLGIERSLHSALPRDVYFAYTSGSGLEVLAEPFGIRPCTPLPNRTRRHSRLSTFAAHHRKIPRATANECSCPRLTYHKGIGHGDTHVPRSEPKANQKQASNMAHCQLPTQGDHV
jgi:hypothetical protein